MEDKQRKRIENNHWVEYIDFVRVRESKRDRQSKRGRERDSKVEINSKKDKLVNELKVKEMNYRKGVIQ